MRLTRGRARGRFAAGAVALALAAAPLTACGDAGGTGGTRGVKGGNLRLMAPAAPGGGWDQTARVAGKALESVGGNRRAEVFNVPGAGGTIGLAQLARAKGDERMLMVMGLVMVGAIEQNRSKVNLTQVTPVARLTEEYEIVVVPADSPFRTLADMVKAWKADPAKVPIAGGSAGGTDQILAGLMAQAAGADPKKVNYIAHSGGGEALSALLGGKVSAGISGVSEFAEHVRSGKLRALAVSSPRRVPGLDVPTIKEAGLDVELSNWRGVVAPPGLSENARKAHTDLLTKMHGSAAWKEALAKNGWTDAFQAGPQFGTFLAAEQTRVQGILARMGIGS
ncbi:tripartite tricarboxylate transporter substrate binding protein [Spirillospora sp. NPDC029432]|uniref:Bug family tripartite tricarboxylate transporter substrate binding protein n=1 Tax=Spirillospora sp. NPDC029432 TaxID=3154599 RepID=UPI0034549D09